MQQRGRQPPHHTANPVGNGDSDSISDGDSHPTSNSDSDPASNGDSDGTPHELGLSDRPTLFDPDLYIVHLHRQFEGRPR